MYEIASKLCDEGYGDFEKCLAVLTAVGGDDRRARNTLEKLINKDVSLTAAD